MAMPVSNSSQRTRPTSIVVASVKKRRATPAVSEAFGLIDQTVLAVAMKANSRAGHAARMAFQNWVGRLSSVNMVIPTPNERHSRMVVRYW